MDTQDITNQTESQTTTWHDEYSTEIIISIFTLIVLIGIIILIVKKEHDVKKTQKEMQKNEIKKKEAPKDPSHDKQIYSEQVKSNEKDKELPKEIKNDEKTEETKSPIITTNNQTTEKNEIQKDWKESSNNKNENKTKDSNNKDKSKQDIIDIEKDIEDIKKQLTQLNLDQSDVIKIFNMIESAKQQYISYISYTSETTLIPHNLEILSKSTPSVLLHSYFTLFYSSLFMTDTNKFNIFPEDQLTQYIQKTATSLKEEKSPILIRLSLINVKLAKNIMLAAQIKNPKCKKITNFIEEIIQKYKFMKKY